MQAEETQALCVCQSLWAIAITGDQIEYPAVFKLTSGKSLSLSLSIWVFNLLPF